MNMNETTSKSVWAGFGMGGLFETGKSKGGHYESPTPTSDFLMNVHPEIAHPVAGGGSRLGIHGMDGAWTPNVRLTAPPPPGFQTAGGAVPPPGFGISVPSPAASGKAGLWGPALSEFGARSYGAGLGSKSGRNGQ